MAAARDKDVRQGVALGFQGGGGLALKLTAKDTTALLAALPKGEWHEVDDLEGTVRVNLSQVVYVRTESAEHRVGFGLS